MNDKRLAVVARRTIAETIAAAFLPTEKSAEATAAHGANCISVMMAERNRAQLAPGTGADALILVSQATTQALEACRDLAEAHRILAALPADLGLPVAVGADCAPNSPFTVGELRSVA